jgi:hypothetical protein
MHCAEILMDLICYEAHRDRLSPEMEAILAVHLAKCEYCNTMFLNFRQLVEEEPKTTSYLQ